MTLVCFFVSTLNDTERNNWFCSISDVKVTQMGNLLTGLGIIVAVGLAVFAALLFSSYKSIAIWVLFSTIVIPLLVVFVYWQQQILKAGYHVDFSSENTFVVPIESSNQSVNGQLAIGFYGIAIVNNNSFSSTIKDIELHAKIENKWLKTRLYTWVQESNATDRVIVSVCIQSGSTDGCQPPSARKLAGTSHKGEAFRPSRTSSAVKRAQFCGRSGATAARQGIGRSLGRAARSRVCGVAETWEAPVGNEQAVAGVRNGQTRRSLVPRADRSADRNGVSS